MQAASRYIVAFALSAASLSFRPAAAEDLWSLSALFPSPSSTVAAYPRWESAAISPIPAVLGAVRHGRRVGGTLAPALKVVAIASQDRGAHALVVARGRYDEVRADPTAALPGRRLLVTSASTGRLFAERCLAGWNVAVDGIEFVDGKQAEIRRGLAAGEAEVAVVWTPTTYRVAAEAAKARPLPCPGTAGLDIPAVIVVRADLLAEPDPARRAANLARLGRVVAEHLGAWAKVVAGPGEAAKRLARAYRDAGATVSEPEAGAELAARCPPDLDGQRAALASPGGGALPPLATALGRIMDFMVSSGTLAVGDRPAAGDLIDPSVLDAVAADPVLAAIARGAS